jgi:hypothetical protein
MGKRDDELAELTARVQEGLRAADAIVAARHAADGAKRAEKLRQARICSGCGHEDYRCRCSTGPHLPKRW